MDKRATSKDGMLACILIVWLACGLLTVIDCCRARGSGKLPCLVAPSHLAYCTGEECLNV